MALASLGARGELDGAAIGVLGGVASIDRSEGVDARL